MGKPEVRVAWRNEGNIKALYDVWDRSDPRVGIPRTWETKKIRSGKLKTVRLCCIQPIINALMRELTHVVFSLQRCCESTISEHRMKAFIKVYMTFPCPWVCPSVQINYPNVSLVTIRFFDCVSFANAHNRYFSRWGTLKQIQSRAKRKQ